MKRRRITEDDLTLRDAMDTPYPPRPLALKILDTVVRSAALVLVLVAIGLIWEAFH